MTTYTIAAVEGGGTSFRVAVCQLRVDADSDGGSAASNNNKSLPTINILQQTTIDSSHESPQQTLDECVTFFEEHAGTDGYDGLGIACFGPFGVDPMNPATYGRILPSTPKAPWRNVDIVTPLAKGCCAASRKNNKKEGLVVAVDTDVNAPAWAEYIYANNRIAKSNAMTMIPQKKKISSLAYVTVGTGVGVGLVVNDKQVHGRMHPEGGHVPVQPLNGTAEPRFQGYSWGRDAASSCPFEGKHTVEGMTSSVALTERLQLLHPDDFNAILTARKKRQQGQGNSDDSSSAATRSVLEDLSDDHVIWDHAANALANLCVTLILMLSVEKIVLGGGILRRQGLLGKIRARTYQLMNGYVELPAPDSKEMAELIGPPSSFGDKGDGADDSQENTNQSNSAGLVGAIILVQEALLANKSKKSSSKDGEEDVAIKREAFNMGLIHGMLAGAIGAGLVVRWFFSSRRSSSRRSW